jgi:hypothetical protein
MDHAFQSKNPGMVKRVKKFPNPAHGEPAMPSLALYVLKAKTIPAIGM